MRVRGGCEEVLLLHESGLGAVGGRGVRGDGDAVGPFGVSVAAAAAGEQPDDLVPAPPGDDHGDDHGDYGDYDAGYCAGGEAAAFVFVVGFGGGGG